MTLAVTRRFVSLPKVELHCHLEGSIPLAALWRLVEKYGSDDVTTIEELHAKFAYRDFRHFLDTWIWKSRFIRSYDDIAAIAQAVAVALRSDGIRYGELFCSPGEFEYHHGLGVPEVLQAMRQGLDHGAGASRFRLVVDLVRNFGPATGSRWLHEAATVARECQIIGVGIGGYEAGFPPSLYRDVYSEARKLGLRTTAHAGEGAGAESIWSAVRDLAVDRIGHGTRAIEDAELVRHLAEKAIPLEVCPTSNVLTGVVRDLESHPLRALAAAGVLIVPGADDPAMFHVTLSQEYANFASLLDLDCHGVAALAHTSVDASWASVPEKTAWKTEIATWLTNETQAALPPC